MFWKWRKEKIHAYVVVLNKQCLPSSGIYDIMIVVLGCRQAVKAQDFDSCIRGFESRQPRDYSSRISVKTEVGLFLAY